MRFFKILAISSLALSPLAACGGANEAPAPPPEIEKPVENQASTPHPAAPDVPLTQPDKEPSAEFAALPAPYNTADYARGRRVFKLCSSCHTLVEGGGTMVGPNLYGLFGRQAGSAEGFAYSKVLEEADFVWTPEQVDGWLVDPRGFLKGNRMTFTGVRRPEDRAAVIAYIMSESGYSSEE